MASVSLTNHLAFHSTEKCWWTCCSHYCPCAADEATHTGRAQVKLHPFLSLALGASKWSVSGPSHSMSLQSLAPSQQEAQWAPGLVWTFWRTEKWLALAGNQTLDFLACSVVIIWPQVSQLTSCYTRLIAKPCSAYAGCLTLLVPLYYSFYTAVSMKCLLLSWNNFYDPIFGAFTEWQRA